MELRPYQHQAIESIYRFFEEGDGNPLVVLPTGSGKSVVIAEFARQVYERWKERLVIVSDRKEILQQNTQKILQIWPGAPIGIYSAGIGQRRIAPITVASIQTVYKRAEEFTRAGIPGLLLIDECHMLSRNSDSRYQKFITGLKKFNPQLKIIGFTATPFRLDSGLLTDGVNPIFTDIAYSVSMVDLIRDGYLSPLIGKNSVVQAELSRVRVSGGDYLKREASLVMDKDALTHAAIDDLLRYGSDRKSWLVFGVDVSHVNHISSCLHARGISNRVVTGETLPMLRDTYLKEFTAGKVRALVNCEVLTTGYDAPNIDMIVSLRPTKSVGLWIQICGRGSRLSPGKTDCLIMDFAGNLTEHGPIDEIEIRPKNKNVPGGIFIPPSKTCPNCRREVNAGFLTCPSCGHEFPPREHLDSAHASKASTAPVLAALEPPQELEVDEVNYSRHVKADKPIMLRVMYRCGLQRYFEFICLEHEGFGRNKAVAWWHLHAGTTPPDTVEEALSRTAELRRPKTIFVKRENKWDRIKGIIFHAPGEEPENVFTTIFKETGINI